METLKEIIKRNTSLYPNMDMEDAVKLIYQHTFGMDEEIDIDREYKEALKDQASYLCEDIGGGYYRVYLNGITEGNLTIEKLKDILARSLSTERDYAALEENLQELYDVVREGHFTFEYKEFRKFLDEYIEKGFPILEHSQGYLNQYEPHYVVVRKDILDAEKTSFSKVFLKLYDKKLQDGDITFSKLGIPKPLFVVICNNQNYVPTDELLEKLKVTMKLTDDELKMLYEAGGKKYAQD
ncbi:MAG: hypothetical protein MJ146_00755 [Clostridia bacterium]|nr:hypothetical protein [Clostridia bacterium]